MKKILLIQYRTDDSAPYERNGILKIAGELAEFKALNSVLEDLEWDNPKKLLDGFDGVILGGSGELYFSIHENKEGEEKFLRSQKNTVPVVEYIIENDIPTLGICFGHQMLGKTLGTEVVRDQSQSKSGSHKVNLSDHGKNDKLFKDFPEDFYVQYGHKDSLSCTPKDSLLLANGDKCKVTAFKHKNNIYGVQFHPELDKEDIIFKVKMYPSYTEKSLEEFEKDIKESPYGRKVIENFIKHL